WTNNNDPSQPRRWVLQDFKVVGDEPPKDILKPNPAFGENFKEFAFKGKEAVAKLLQEKRGQVAGAFYREDLGYIDLVWGEVRNKEGKIQGHGLSKIVEKHLDDFSPFEGANALERLGNGLEKIIQNGEVVKQEGGRIGMVCRIGDKTFRVGLKKNWKGEATHNHWIITAYHDREKP
ncbi:putative barnase/colicin E5 family endoribonuclease, partial [Helicobacter mehlei]